ncbi:hypothetical protein [Streptomyces sp. TS71-3]|uniref:hypothetical protein n=1 Tax=Streptomyces sp. TS71-3 TaxID=2733862 RepID=UPI001B010E90|nr:hypothetical protein [Streptomyces sp. TS71-3]GHJ36511.1 hypothetical protein Sm713_21200 [Streptomyces sp. TS71-3]
MASRASSDVPASGSPTGRDRRIPKLPGLGTTWYERGARYWTRRTLSALLWLVVLAFFCFVALSLYQSFRDELPSGLRTVWDWAQVAASCVAVVWGWVVQRRGHRKGLADPPTPGRARSTRRAATGRSTGLAMAGRLLVVIAAPVLPAFAAFCVGWTIAAFTVREYPSEVGARRAMEGDGG